MVASTALSLTAWLNAVGALAVTSTTTSAVSYTHLTLPTN